MAKSLIEQLPKVAKEGWRITKLRKQASNYKVDDAV